MTEPNFLMDEIHVQDQADDTVPSQQTSLPHIATEVTPSVAKSDSRTILKKLEQYPDNVAVAEELYVLSLFYKNRQAILDGGIMASILLALKTKALPVQVVIARTLQLFAQDGSDSCLTLMHLNACSICTDFLQQAENVDLITSIVGLVYWLAQNPKCKQQFVEQGAPVFLRELQLQTKNEILFKYISKALTALSTETKSREELLENVLTTSYSYSHPAIDNFEDFNPYSNPVPNSLLDVISKSESPSKISTTMISPQKIERSPMKSPSKSPIKRMVSSPASPLLSPRKPSSPKRMPVEKTNDMFIMQTSPQKN